MHRYQIIHSMIHAGIATALLLFVQNIEALSQALREITQSNEGGKWLVLACVPLLAGLFKMSDQLARLLIERVPALSPLLRRALAGRDSIEGDWPLIVVDGDRAQLLYLGFLSITYVDGSLKVEGVDWHPDGNPAHTFRSEQSRYSNGLLQYWYVQGVNNSMRGYTEMHFFPRGELAQRLAGSFLDKAHTNVRFYAHRQARRPKRAEREKIQDARGVWAAIEPVLPDLLSRDISMDWR